MGDAPGQSFPCSTMAVASLLPVLKSRENLGEAIPVRLQVSELGIAKGSVFPFGDLA